jgi:hypothetical protein
MIGADETVATLSLPLQKTKCNVTTIYFHKLQKKKKKITCLAFWHDVVCLTDRCQLITIDHCFLIEHVNYQHTQFDSFEETMYDFDCNSKKKVITTSTCTYTVERRLTPSSFFLLLGFTCVLAPRRTASLCAVLRELTSELQLLRAKKTNKQKPKTQHCYPPD